MPPANPFLGAAITGGFIALGLAAAASLRAQPVELDWTPGNGGDNVSLYQEANWTDPATGLAPAAGAVDANIDLDKDLHIRKGTPGGGAGAGGQLLMGSGELWVSHATLRMSPNNKSGIDMGASNPNLTLIDGNVFTEHLTGATVTMQGRSELTLYGIAPLTNTTINLQSSDCFVFFLNRRPADIDGGYLSNFKVNGAAAVLWSNVAIREYYNGSALRPLPPSSIGLKAFDAPDLQGTQFDYDSGFYGGVGLGSASYNAGTYTVEGWGADIWGASDEFRFVYQTLSGDGEIVARVNSIANTHTWAKAGVMIRESLTANAPYIMTLQRPDKQVVMQRRATSSATTVQTVLAGGTSSVKFVRLVRSGNSFSSHYSTTSATGPWTQNGVSQTINMPATVYIGLAVASHNGGEPCRAVFSQVSVQQSGGPGGPATVFQSDFQAAVVEASTPVANVNAGTAIGSWSYQTPTNINVYGDASGTQKALCPDALGPNDGYGLTAHFTNSLLLSSNVEITLQVARGRYSSPGTGKRFYLTGYNAAGDPSLDLQVFANQNQPAGTNGAVYWNQGGTYTNWFGTNYSVANDIRQIGVSATGYNTNNLSALKLQLQETGYIVSLDRNNDGAFEWVSSLLTYNGSPVSINRIALTGGANAGDWFDNITVTGVPGGNSVGVFDGAQDIFSPWTEEDQIRSFLLKKGYQVTLSQDAAGQGFSKVYVATEADLAVNLPAELDSQVSWMRVLPWQWIAKKGWAGSDTSPNFYPTTIGAFWNYEWEPTGSSTLNREFVPMIKGRGQNKTFRWEEVRVRANQTHFLGFNEPMNANQGDLTVDEAIALWPKAQHLGLRLGSPARTDNANGDAWLQEFMTKAATNGYRVDYVCVHNYNRTTAAGLQSWLQAEYNKYQRPIWLTEFRRENNDSPTAAQNKTYLETVLPMLESLPFLERYAYYNFDGHNSSVGSGGITNEVGSVYASIFSNPAYQNTGNPAWCSVNLASPANGDILFQGSIPSASATVSLSNAVISSVEFFADDVSLGTDNTEPYEASLDDLSSGLHTLYATATTTFGEQAFSPANQVWVSKLEILPPSPGATGMIQWSAVPGETYRVEYCIDLSSPSWTLISQQPAAALVEQVTDPGYGSDAARFYRVVWLP